MYSRDEPPKTLFVCRIRLSVVKKRPNLKKKGKRGRNSTAASHYTTDVSNLLPPTSGSSGFSIRHLQSIAQLSLLRMNSYARVHNWVGFFYPCKSAGQKQIVGWDVALRFDVLCLRAVVLFELPILGPEEAPTQQHVNGIKFLECRQQFSVVKISPRTLYLSSSVSG